MGFFSEAAGRSIESWTAHRSPRCRSGWVALATLLLCLGPRPASAEVNQCTATLEIFPPQLTATPIITVHPLPIINCPGLLCSGVEYSMSSLILPAGVLTTNRFDPLA